MKNYITPEYIFTPGEPGVGAIDTKIDNFNIKYLVGIINITRGEVIFWPSLKGRGYLGFFNGSGIVLEYDTSTHDGNDILQIIYDSTAEYPSHVSAELGTNATEILDALRQLQYSIEILKNTIGQTRPDANGRLRILLDAISGSLTLGTITSVGTVTTVSTLTNQSQIGGINAIEQINNIRRLSADSLLNKINLS